MASLVQPRLIAKEDGESEAFFSGERKQEPFVPYGVGTAVQGVSKSFLGRKVLDDISIDIQAGQFIAIVGRSGSGKSTLLRILAGLETPDTGRVTRGTATQSDLRIMFQDGRLLPWRRVIDNVTLGLPKSEHPRAYAALESVGLADRARDWPRILSGGQRQRVALARALATNPRLILLDEPLGALDALTRLEMQALIVSLWQRARFTAILVTHDVAEAAILADRILLIEDGRIGLDLRVDLPRPRRTSAALTNVEQQVLRRILAH